MKSKRHVTQRTFQQIKIEAKVENDHWTISVSDNGIGIIEEYFDKGFSIFQRLHTKEEYTGTRIGLEIIKKIIEHRSIPSFHDATKLAKSYNRIK